MYGQECSICNLFKWTIHAQNLFTLTCVLSQTAVRRWSKMHKEQTPLRDQKDDIGKIICSSYALWLTFRDRLLSGDASRTRLGVQVFQARSTGETTTGRRHSESRLARTHLGMPLEEQEEVAGEKYIWASFHLDLTQDVLVGERM